MLTADPTEQRGEPYDTEIQQQKPQTRRTKTGTSGDDEATVRGQHPKCEAEDPTVKTLVRYLQTKTNTRTDTGSDTDHEWKTSTRTYTSADTYHQTSSESQGQEKKAKPLM